MARILITRSADGLGQLSAKSLADQGHQVVLHARNSERGRYAKQQVPRAEHVIVGDLSDIDEIKNVAYEANVLGRFDAVIHNAGVYRAPPKEIFVVNTIAFAQNSAPDLESGLKLVFLVSAIALAIALLLILTIPEISLDAELPEKSETRLTSVPVEG